MLYVDDHIHVSTCTTSKVLNWWKIISVFVGEEPCSSNKESSKSRIKACVSDADLWMLLDAVIPCINLPTCTAVII